MGEECSRVVVVMHDRGKRTWKRPGKQRNREAGRSDTRPDRGKREAIKEAPNRGRRPTHDQELALRQSSLSPEPLLVLLATDPADMDRTDGEVEDDKDDGRPGDEERDEEDDAREDGGVGGGWISSAGRQSQPGTSQWLTTYA